MKKGSYNSKKAQNLIEFAVIAVIIGVAAYVFISPYAENIKSQFVNSAPQKNGEAVKTANMISMLGENFKSYSSGINLLSNSEDLNAKTFANQAQEALSIASIIKNNEADKLSDKELIKTLEVIAKNKKETTSETSGSVANFISVSNSEFNKEEAAASEDIKAALAKQSISLSVGNSLVTAANQLASEIKNQIIAGNISKENLILNDNQSIDEVNLDIIFKQSFEITSSSEEPLNNLLSLFSLAEKISSQKDVDNKIKEQYSKLIEITKKSLK